MLKEEDVVTGKITYYVAGLKFETYKDDAGFWRWRCRAKNGKKVASSGESFASKRNALRALDAFIKAFNEQ